MPVKWGRAYRLRQMQMVFSYLWVSTLPVLNNFSSEITNFQLFVSHVASFFQYQINLLRFKFYWFWLLMVASNGCCFNLPCWCYVMNQLTTFHFIFFILGQFFFGCSVTETYCIHFSFFIVSSLLCVDRVVIFSGVVQADNEVFRNFFFSVCKIITIFSFLLTFYLSHMQFLGRCRQQHFENQWALCCSCHDCRICCDEDCLQCMISELLEFVSDYLILAFKFDERHHSLGIHKLNC